MLLRIFLLNLTLCLIEAGTDAKSSPKRGLGGLENLVDRLELRLRDMELRLEETEKEKEKQAQEKMELDAKIKDMERRLEAKDKELESKDKEMEARMEEFEDKMKEELEKRGLEASTTTNVSDKALTKPSVRDLPIVIISAWQSQQLKSPQTVTFESFLANYNNGERPGGGDGVLDLDTGIFTCITAGYYRVSFSANGALGPDYNNQGLDLYKNGYIVPESKWYNWTNDKGASLNDNIGVTSSRILILHMDAGDSMELRMVGDYVREITLNIELTGLGFD